MQPSATSTARKRTFGSHRPPFNRGREHKPKKKKKKPRETAKTTTRYHELLAKHAHRSERGVAPSAAKRRWCIWQSWNEFLEVTGTRIPEAGADPDLLWDFATFLSDSEWRDVTNGLSGYLTVVVEILQSRKQLAIQPMGRDAYRTTIKKAQSYLRRDDPVKAFPISADDVSRVPKGVDRRRTCTWLNSGCRANTMEAWREELITDEGNGLARIACQKVKVNTHGNTFSVTTSASTIAKNDWECPPSLEWVTWILDRLGATRHSARRSLALYLRVICHLEFGWQTWKEIPKAIKRKVATKLGWFKKSTQWERYSRDYMLFVNFAFAVDVAVHREIFGSTQGWAERNPLTINPSQDQRAAPGGDKVNPGGRPLAQLRRAALQREKLPERKKKQPPPLGVPM